MNTFLSLDSITKIWSLCSVGEGSHRGLWLKTGNEWICKDCGNFTASNTRKELTALLVLSRLLDSPERLRSPPGEESPFYSVQMQRSWLKGVSWNSMRHAVGSHPLHDNLWWGKCARNGLGRLSKGITTMLAFKSALFKVDQRISFL